MLTLHRCRKLLDYSMQLAQARPESVSGIEAIVTAVHASVKPPTRNKCSEVLSLLCTISQAATEAERAHWWEVAFQYLYVARSTLGHENVTPHPN